ncbi:hypothetical protein ACLKA6_010751 [Drosophila palustris]
MARTPSKSETESTVFGAALAACSLAQSGSLNEQLSGKVATPVGPKMSSRQRRSLKGSLKMMRLMSMIRGQFLSCNQTKLAQLQLGLGIYDTRNNMVFPPPCY